MPRPKKLNIMQEPAKTKVTVIGAKGKVLKNVLIKVEVEQANRRLYEQALKRQYPSVKKFKWESGTFHMFE